VSHLTESRDPEPSVLCVLGFRQHGESSFVQRDGLTEELLGRYRLDLLRDLRQELGQVTVGNVTIDRRGRETERPGDLPMGSTG